MFELADILNYFGMDLNFVDLESSGSLGLARQVSVGFQEEMIDECAKYGTLYFAY